MSMAIACNASGPRAVQNLEVTISGASPVANSPNSSIANPIPIDSAIIGLSGWGTSFIVSTMARIGLVVRLATSEAATSQPMRPDFGVLTILTKHSDDFRYYLNHNRAVELQ